MKPTNLNEKTDVEYLFKNYTSSLQLRHYSINDREGFVQPLKEVLYIGFYLTIYLTICIAPFDFVTFSQQKRKSFALTSVLSGCGCNDKE